MFYIAIYIIIWIGNDLYQDIHYTQPLQKILERFTDFESGLWCTTKLFLWEKKLSQD